MLNFQRLSLKRQIKILRFFIWLLLALVALGLLNSFDLNCSNESITKLVVGQHVNKSYQLPSYDRNLPLIFVGGMPRSGTTLMRAMLDAHPHVHCGQETRIIPRLMFMHREIWMGGERERLEEAGIDESIVDSAMAAFILQVVVNHGKSPQRMCNKDPFVMKFATVMKRLFPNSKYVLMVRDGRAVVHSLITRNVTISGFNLTNYTDCLSKWNAIVHQMCVECARLGPSACLRVHYEELVLQPEATMRRVLAFLDVSWDDRVLAHHQLVDDDDDEISLSRAELSTAQVIRPINLDSLVAWHAHVPVSADVVARVAPMLAELGYEVNYSKQQPPSYGLPHPMVVSNTRHIRRHRVYWEEKAKRFRLPNKQSH